MSNVQGTLVTKTDFSANGQMLVVDVALLNTVRIEFSGTYSFTAAFEASIDATKNDGSDGTWFPFQVSMTNASTNVVSHATANATQAYEASCHSVAKVRVRLTAFTSAGTHRVGISGSFAAIEPAPSVPFPATQAVTLPVGTAYSLVTAASTNGALVITGTKALTELTISNPTATAAYVKLYNKATTPTVGTDVPIVTKRVAATGSQDDTVSLTFGGIGKRFPLGIGIAVTAAAAATDTAVTVAGIQIHGTYI